MLNYNKWLKYNENLNNDWSDEWSIDKDVVLTWKNEVDIKDEWNMYNMGKINMKTFVDAYSDKLNTLKSKLTDKESVEKLDTLIEKMNIKTESDDISDSEILPVFDRIYDWADSNDVLIKTS